MSRQFEIFDIIIDWKISVLLRTKKPEMSLINSFHVIIIYQTDHKIVGDFFSTLGKIILTSLQYEYNNINITWYRLLWMRRLYTYIKNKECD